MVKIVRKTNKQAYDALNKASQNLNGVTLKVGWFEGNNYPKEKGGEDTPVAYVASIHEFGHATSGIPARPFMRPTVEREENNWRKFLDSQSKHVISGKLSPALMMDGLGLNVAGEIAKSIKNVTSPPLKKATIAAKVRKMANKKLVGSLDKPLVETALMIDSVTHIVEE